MMPKLGETATTGGVWIVAVFAAALAGVVGLGFFDTEELMATTGHGDFTLHIVAFFVLGAIGGLRWSAVPLFGFLLAVAVGLEVPQHFGPWHEAGTADVIADAIGVGLGLATARLVRTLGALAQGTWR